MLDYGSLQNRLKSPFLKFLGRNQYLAHRRMQSMCSASVCVLPLSSIAVVFQEPWLLMSSPYPYEIISKSAFFYRKSMAYENF